VAKASFCTIAGESPQEIASEVVRSMDFKEIGSNARYVAYANREALLTLTVTTPSNPAHPSVACRQARQDKNGSWTVVTNIRCGAPDDVCKSMVHEFDVLDEQMKREIEKSQGKP